MNRLTSEFQAARRAGRKILMPFLTAGYPDRDIFRQLALAVQEVGCDGLEIGVPFSDPSADGPVIQESSQRALGAGETVHSVMAGVAGLREEGLAIPVVLMSYLNPLLSYGMSGFLREAKEAGVDGVLIVDLPAEEAAEVQSKAGSLSLDVVMMVAPTTAPRRLARVVGGGGGFIYCVSTAGVTGEGRPDLAAVEDMVRRVRAQTPLPALVGFGVDGPETAGAISAVADGVIVGSALLRQVPAPVGDGRPVAADEAHAAVRRVTAFLGAVRAAV